MQVTWEMVQAAQAATPRWMEATDSEINAILQAALNAAPKATGGLVDGPLFRPRAGCMGDGYVLPPGAAVIVNLGGDMLHTSPGAKRVVQTKPSGGAGEPDSAGPNPYRPMPVTEPRPLARQSALHLHLGIGEVAMARMIRFRDDYRPPTPLPIHEATADSEALYDPEEVKAWYDALPQAADG